MSAEMIKVGAKWRIEGPNEVIVPGAVVAMMGGRRTQMVKVLRLLSRKGSLTRAIFTYDLEAVPSPSYTNRGSRREQPV